MRRPKAAGQREMRRPKAAGASEARVLTVTVVPSTDRRPAAFLDRDGVLNHDVGYLFRVEEFRWIDGAREAIRALNEAGYWVFVVTNQSGVARGYYDEAAVRRLHDWMQRDLAAVGAHVDAFRYCPHHPEGTEPAYRRTCRCRKPGPGMIEALAEAWPVDLANSVVIGDKARDLEAGAALGIAGHLFEDGRLDRLVAAILAAAGSQSAAQRP
jgi:D-glycero-D-manno-heptose 1,7-bisphosphate phosphatase